MLLAGPQAMIGAAHPWRLAQQRADTWRRWVGVGRAKTRGQAPPNGALIPEPILSGLARSGARSLKPDGKS